MRFLGISIVAFLAYLMLLPQLPIMQPFFKEMVRQGDAGYNRAAAIMLGSYLLIGATIGLGIGWLTAGKDGRLRSPKEWIPSALAKGRERSIALGEKIIIASISSIVVFIVLHGLGFNPEFKALVVPIGFVAVFI